MNRLIKSALYSPEEFAMHDVREGISAENSPCDINKNVDPWEHAAERIKKIDPTGSRRYELWLKLSKENKNE